MPDPPSSSDTSQGSSSADSLVVVVRAPNQETQDFRVECPQTWSVLRLKEHLQQTYQGNPVPTDQKLIYLGQLLDDNSLLREVLRQDGSCSQHTVHLVCRPSQGASTRGDDASAGATNRSHSSELRYRGPMIQYEMASLRPDVYSAHVLALQSMYAQYYQQLIAHQQALMAGSNPASSIQYSFNPHAFQLGEQQQRQLFDQMAAAAASGVNQAQLNNNAAVGGQQPNNNINNNNIDNNNANNQRANDEDANAWGGAGNANRDWLDVMYVAIRAAVFATFVYFYSSLERFVLVTGLGMLLYLYQQGLLGLPNVQPQPQAAAAAAAAGRAAPAQQPQVAPQQAEPAPIRQADVQPPVLVADREGAHVDNNNPAAAAQHQREDIERLQAAMDGEHPQPMGGDTPPVAPSSGAPPQTPLAAAANLLRAFLVSLIPDNNNAQ